MVSTMKILASAAVICSSYLVRRTEAAAATTNHRVIDETEQQEYIFEKKTVDVRIPFEVPADGKKYGIEMEYSAREFFPSQDILVRNFEFLGVQVDDKEIPNHVDAYTDKEELHLRDDVIYAFHHTNIHQGLQTDGKFVRHGSISFHRNGVFVHGNHHHNTTFGRWGIRFRPDTRVLACLHGLNRASSKKTFWSKWRIDYEEIPADFQDERALVSSWWHESVPFRAEVDDNFLVTKRMVAQQDFLLVGWTYHQHTWVNNFEVFYQEELIWSHDENPSDAGRAILLDEPLYIAEGSAIVCNMSATFHFRNERTMPSTFTMLTHLADGSDRVRNPKDIVVIEDSVTFLEGEDDQT